MRLKKFLPLPGLIFCTAALAANLVLPKPADPYFAEFQPWKSSAPAQRLKTNDRLAICGDSITEQKMYSRIIETYLTVCVPLAPVMVLRVFDLIRRVREEGYTILVVEQNVRQVLKLVDRAYLLEVGRIKMEGRAADLADQDFVRKAYVGL